MAVAMVIGSLVMNAVTGGCVVSCGMREGNDVDENDDLVESCVDDLVDDADDGATGFVAFLAVDAVTEDSVVVATVIIEKKSSLMSLDNSSVENKSEVR